MKTTNDIENKTNKNDVTINQDLIET